MAKICKKCDQPSLSYSALCLDCQRQRRRHYAEKNQHKPCAKCGENQRMKGHTRCHNCSKERRIQSLKRNQHKLCAKCGENPRTTNNTQCVECAKKYKVRYIKRNQHKPCTKCGVNSRMKDSGWCHDCHNKYQYERREENRDEYNEEARKYYHEVWRPTRTDEEIEESKENTKKWFRDNREKWNAYMREYRRHRKQRRSYERIAE